MLHINHYTQWSLKIDWRTTSKHIFDWRGTLNYQVRKRCVVLILLQAHCSFYCLGEWTEQWTMNSFICRNLKLYVASLRNQQSVVKQDTIEEFYFENSNQNPPLWFDYWLLRSCTGFSSLVAVCAPHHNLHISCILPLVHVPQAAGGNITRCFCNTDAQRKAEKCTAWTHFIDGRELSGPILWLLERFSQRKMVRWSWVGRQRVFPT